MVLEDRGRTPTAKTRPGRFTVVKHTFAALEGGTSSASALYGGRRWTVVTYDKFEPDMAHTVAALSSGPLGGTIPLQLSAEAAHKNFYELKDCIEPYMEAAFSSRK